MTDDAAPYMPVVVAVVDPGTGEQGFQYGYAREVCHEMNRPDLGDRRSRWEAAFSTIPDPLHGAPEHTTRVEWAAPPATLNRWPAAADWRRGRELAARASPDAVLAAAPTD